MNLVITSGSALWALAAPVLVPLLMLIGIEPETTQAVHRVADSVTNCITPMSPYFVMALGFIQQYRKSAGIGTLASFTLPIAAVVWGSGSRSSWPGTCWASRSASADRLPSDPVRSSTRESRS